MQAENVLHTPAQFSGYRPPMRFRTALTALAFLALTGVAGAQEQEEGQSRLRGEAWYAEQLSELAEVLGGAHYLRILCDGRGDQRWRDYMRGVIDREPNYNSQLVEGFNRGYREQESRFQDCDRAAEQMEAELRARGLRVSGGLSARHAE